MRAVRPQCCPVVVVALLFNSRVVRWACHGVQADFKSACKPWWGRTVCGAVPECVPLSPIYPRPPCARVLGVCQADEVRAEPALPGHRVMMPGDKEAATAAHRREHGIPLDHVTSGHLLQWAERLKVAPPKFTTPAAELPPSKL